jgi:hypothetical protein
MWIVNSNGESTFLTTIYLKGLLIRKVLVASLYTVHVLQKVYNNVKLFFADDAGDYKPIGCVAATLNNSVLYKAHISCDETVKYFVCKQSEYICMVIFDLFLPNMYVVSFCDILW